MSTIGYIVLDNGKPMVEFDGYGDAGPKPLLALSYTQATVFPSRRAAKRAIQRNNKYSDMHNLNWGNAYTIVRLEPRP